MQRRTFLSVLGTTGVTVLSGAGAVTAQEPSATQGMFESLVFDSTASLLNKNKELLTDDSLIAVWAEPTAYNDNTDGNSDAVDYPEDVLIPLVASDGGVLGFGAPIGRNDTEFNYGNEEFLLNILDEEADGPNGYLR